MQDNSITLAVDTANTGTTTDKVFTRHREDSNRTTYVGPGHVLDSRNMLQFYRTDPNRNGDFRGVARTAIKFTLDIDVDNADGSGQITAPLIVEANFSVPVGATAAQTLEARQHLIALLDDDSISGDLVDLQEI